MTVPTALEQEAFDAARDWALHALDIAAEVEATGFQASEKGAAFDMITPADGMIERYLRDEVARRFPDHTFLGEEGGGDAPGVGLTWVVDPIDGTLNFATGLAGAATSIALVASGDPIIGAVADFNTRLVYRAMSSGGGLLRHDGLTESAVEPEHTEIGSARVFLEWGWEDLDSVMLGTLSMLAEGRQHVVRMVGGAAYALLHVALHGGTMLGIGLRLWDVAAGVVIAKAAGLETRLWHEEGSTHVLAGSARDVRELAPIVERFGSRRVAALV